MTSELNRDGSGKTTSPEQQAYLNELLLALRMRGVPGPRIAEAVAEVNAHLSETGEDPREAFGPAKTYAGEVVAALGEQEAPVPFWRTALSWTAAIYGLGGALGAWLVIDGALTAATDEPGIGGLPAVASLVLGVAVLVALGIGQVHLIRKREDQVLDPRNGADMSPPLPRWLVPLMLTVPVLIIVLAVVVSLTAR
jgi:hypothetical protein